MTSEERPAQPAFASSLAANRLVGAAVLAVTPGEPAGIGPDLLIALAQRERACDWAVLADPDLLTRRAQRLGLPLQICAAPTRRPGALQVLPTPLAVQVAPGRPEAANAASLLAALRKAVHGCLAGQFAALVTGPLQKSVIADAGFAFSGHTEFLRDASGAADALMLLVAGRLRVACATTHLALKDVPRALSAELLHSKLRLLLNGLVERFGLDRPRVAVLGLNPHAGEAGHLGREEIECIEPVCAALRAEGAQVAGPIPADTAFTPQRLQEVDAVLAMYHDQGLPVLKYAGFGQAVNLTLGLPFPRTSVDHGTALELAGTGKADAGSMAAALALAASAANASASCNARCSATPRSGAQQGQRMRGSNAQGKPPASD